MLGGEILSMGVGRGEILASTAASVAVAVAVAVEEMSSRGV